ncbi:hypothetical protein GCM10027275_18740 [Rhabdobacter roseus]|uniref:Uncharacterized protein n=1 Tax=Rhabdobacter roseus TaxID=1655419 RepID=A0A840TVX0_9BACT|nr:hypothetical protein [Rhabdobacter roseus]MBB5283799.1 hypothetical protein [Rhabdobacter roseus]
MRVLFFVLFLNLGTLGTLACTSQPARTEQASRLPSTSPDTAAPRAVVQIHEIAKQTQEDIELILGKVGSLEASADGFAGCLTCQKYTYQQGTVEIVYINDAADWIRVRPPAPRLVADALAVLGLPERAPDFSEKTTKRWENHEGLRQITVHHQPDGTITEIIVKAITP